MRYLFALLAALLFVLPASAQTTLTAGTVKVSWNAVTEDIDSHSLAGVVITYRVYGSQGCGTKTLQATTTGTSATIPVAVGCYSLAVSASDSAGEGAVSPTLTLTIATAQALPAVVTGVAVSQ